MALSQWDLNIRRCSYLRLKLVGARRRGPPRPPVVWQLAEDSLQLLPEALVELRD